MDRISNYVPNDLVESADLNALQDRIDNVRRASKDGELADWQRTGQSVIRQISAVTVGATSSVDIDDLLDWRGYLVEGWIATLDNADDVINGSNEHFVNAYLRRAKHFVGFLGNGASTVFDRTLGAHYYIEADFDPSGPTWSWVVYANSSNGRLRLHNVAGIDRRAIVCVRAIGRES